MRLSVIACALINLLWLLPQDCSADAHFVPLPPLSQAEAQAVADTLLSEQLLPSRNRPDDGDENLRSFWAGNNPELLARIDGYEIAWEFDGAPDGASTPVPRPPFKIYFAVDGARLLVRHSAPNDPNLRGGVRFSFQPRERRTAFVAGPGESGVAIAVARPREEGTVAVLVCPRWPEARGGRILFRKLQPVPYRATTVHARVRARARGALTSGHLVGRAEARILTTSDIPPAVLPIDSVEQNDPLVEVRYRPTVSPEMPFGNSGRYSGVRSLLELVTQAGLRRISFAEDVAYIYRVQLTKAFKTIFLQSEFDVEPGPCDLVYRQQFRWNSYDKTAPLRERPRL